MNINMNFNASTMTAIHENNMRNERDARVRAVSDWKDDSSDPRNFIRRPNPEDYDTSHPYYEKKVKALAVYDMIVKNYLAKKVKTDAKKAAVLAAKETKEAEEKAVYAAWVIDYEKRCVIKAREAAVVAAAKAAECEVYWSNVRRERALGIGVLRVEYDCGVGGTGCTR